MPIPFRSEPNARVANRLQTRVTCKRLPCDTGFQPVPRTFPCRKSTHANPLPIIAERTGYKPVTNPCHVQSRLPNSTARRLSSLPRTVQLHDDCRQQPLVFGQRQRLMSPHDDHDVVPGGQVVLKMAKRLAQQSPNPVAPHRRPHLARRAQPQPRVTQVIGPGINHERPPRLAHLPVEDRRELQPRAKVMRFWECVVVHRADGVGAILRRAL
jgi:hypothetical protein